MSENNDMNDFELSPELFERSGVTRVYRRRSPLFKFRIRVFCSLHRPVSLKSRLYHYTITCLILFSCVTVNVFDELFGTLAVTSMAISDLLLTCILTAELFLRLWSSDCITDFRGCKGKLRYLKRHGVLRALDLLGIITFSTFVYLQRIGDNFGTFIRLLHVVQVLQIYRLIFPLLKLMISTVAVQLKQLYIASMFAIILFMIMSFSIYLKDIETEKKYSVLDSFWFTFVTMTTIGYGDLVPHTYWGKALVCTFGFCGICAFQLPGNIFGTGLAIKLKDEQKKLQFQYPAANLMQTFWRCYSTDKDSKQTSVWKLYKRKRTITERDKQCIRFILKFRFFRARRQFKTVTDPNRFNDDSEIQLDLLRKVSLIENILIELKDKTHELRAEYDSICNQLQELLHNLETQ